MATLIDERPEDVNDGEEITTFDQAPAEEAPQQEPSPQPEVSEEEIPEKYKGKSTADIVRMHRG